MFGRATGVFYGTEMEAGPGSPLLSQLIPAVEATAGSSVLQANSIVAGWIQRTTAGAGFTDTWPSADSIIKAMPNLGVGDCFDLIYQNTVAFAMTFAAGTGIITGTGTLNVAASITRLYKHTVLANKPQSILVGTNDGSTAVLTGFTAAQIATIMPGMGVTGTGVPASATVLGAAPDAGTITISANTTSANSNIPFTFFPRIRLDSIGSLAA